MATGARGKLMLLRHMRSTMLLLLIAATIVLRTIYVVVGVLLCALALLLFCIVAVVGVKPGTWSDGSQEAGATQWLK